MIMANDDEFFLRNIVDRQKALFPTWASYCQWFSLSQISDTPQAGFQPRQNLRSDFVDNH